MERTLSADVVSAALEEREAPRLAWGLALAIAVVAALVLAGRNARR